MSASIIGATQSRLDSTLLRALSFHRDMHAGECVGGGGGGEVGPSLGPLETDLETRTCAQVVYLEGGPWKLEGGNGEGEKGG